MSKDKLIIIPNKKKFNYIEYNSFILPLKDYSIGFDVYFNSSEINKLSKKYNIYVIINKFLHKKELNNIKNIINKLKNIKGFFIEDLGLIEIIGKEKVILYQNHIINNYVSINYLNKLNINNVVVSNELTINELNNIKLKTNSKLYYFYITKNIIMYSRRKLLSNYYKYFKIKKKNKIQVISESLSHKKLIIKEEGDNSIIYNYNTFCASKYLKDLNKYDYLIINLTLINSEEENIIFKNINNIKLYDLIDSDFYFLENEIKYKVSEL